MKKLFFSLPSIILIILTMGATLSQINFTYADNGSCSIDSSGNPVGNCNSGFVPTKIGPTCLCTASNLTSPSADNFNNPSLNPSSFKPAHTCDNGTEGIQTGLGCIPSNPGSFANTLFRLVLGFAGGLAILFIVVGGYKVATSGGNPDSLEDGRAMITHAIIGLGFILLATVILGIIGVDILGISFFHWNTSTGGIIITK